MCTPAAPPKKEVRAGHFHPTSGFHCQIVLFFVTAASSSFLFPLLRNHSARGLLCERVRVRACACARVRQGAAVVMAGAGEFWGWILSAALPHLGTELGRQMYRPSFGPYSCKCAALLRGVERACLGYHARACSKTQAALNFSYRSDRVTRY